MTNVPELQCAVQLVGPDELILNRTKKIVLPGRCQILCRVEAVGLCFSDLKLLKQFSSHVRKGELVSGIDPEILKEIPSYVPGETPTVPGHETVVRIEAVGPGVEKFKCGQRYLVQSDYRWLRTASSNGAFGYNFEGGLQEYVLLDERVITSPDGESMMIPVSEELSSSAAALVEPWACVEHAYVSTERRIIKSGGQMLVVADTEVGEDAFHNLFNKYGRPAQITWVSKFSPPGHLDVPVKKAEDVSVLEDAGYDDVIYFGSEARQVEALFAKVGANGLLNIVLCGGRFGRDVVTLVGRIHYGPIRIVGTTGSDPAEAMEYIPETDEIRPGDKINVIGAGGPMGVMHVIRNLSFSGGIPEAWNIPIPPHGRVNLDVGLGDAHPLLSKTLAERWGKVVRAHPVPKEKEGKPGDPGWVTWVLILHLSDGTALYGHMGPFAPPGRPM